jgi:phosphatidylglycerophosphate synthase
MPKVRVSLGIGLTADVAVLAALGAAVGLGAAGWLIGLAVALIANVLLARALTRAGAILGPADWVTLARATLVTAIAALVADSILGHGAAANVGVLVALASVALVLDAVDGQVARRTGTVSALGARFDMETDAFLILVLSVYDARLLGAWVLTIGAARYAFVAAGWAWAWLRQPPPPRYWGKVVAAIQGIVLTVVAADLLPRPVAAGITIVALALLAESFGREVWWQARRRHGEPLRSRVLGRALTTAAFAIVWLALVFPNRLERIHPTAFIQIPIEGLVLVLAGLLLPRWPRQILAVAVGAVLGVLVVIKALDIGFYEELDRPFNPVIDWSSLSPAIGVVQDSVGRGWADAGVALAVLLVLLVFAAVIWSALRLARVTASHRTRSARGVGAVAAVWILCASFGVSVVPGSPVAACSAAALAADQVRDAGVAVQDQQKFESSLASKDPISQTPDADLLTGLRGKDVIFAFIESYGQVAVQGTTFSPAVDSVLQAGTTTLDAAGYSSQSAFLNSPTFGGISWLAHSTLQSGLWVDNQQRYNQLVASDRFTLSDAFKGAGWRTVGDVPSDTKTWPQGTSFYHYDQLYDEHNVGYVGPKFSYASMPDQYSLSAFQRNELQPGHAPVMAEIDLVSSHTPWTPLPHMVDWDAVGDGSIYNGMPEQGPAPKDVWPDGPKVQATYGESVQYSLNSLISWVTNLHDDNLVLVMLGDHQPATIVSGAGASHEVPISIIAKDPAVLQSISSWNWQDGLLPSPQAPVWPMDAFRNRFLDAYSG